VESLAGEKREMEQALREGRFHVISEPGREGASREFLSRLDALGSSARRLALARAYVQPWRGGIAEEVPECFRKEFGFATAEFLAEYGSTADLDLALASFFAPGAVPVNEALLLHVSEFTPAQRDFTLLFAFWVMWHGEDDARPLWLDRAFRYARWLVGDESRAVKTAQSL
jgi:hypothetical protein